jgi:ankyrin repeat protein
MTIDDSLRSPLSYAAELGHVAIVELLLKQDGTIDEISRTDAHGKTPLDYAVDNKHRNVVKLFNEAIERRETSEVPTSAVTESLTEVSVSPIVRVAPPAIEQMVSRLITLFNLALNAFPGDH